MQRKAYAPGIAALLAALLVGCTGGSGDGSTTDDSNPGDAGTASPAAEPGRYRTLPEPCTAVGHGTLDELLPGIRQITDADQRETAYEGEATLTYDTDRKVGCRWKVDSQDATDHLLVDFERVVSYDNAVSDDSQAEQLFAEKEAAAHLPEPTATESATESAAAGSTPAGGTSDAPSGSPSPSGSSSPSASASATPTELQPRVLEELGDEAFLDDELSSSGSTAKQRTVTVAFRTSDEAFLDDELSSSGSTAKQRTVTVAFRTSNVIVTIEYAEQPAAIGVVPDSQEMQDRAQKLASQLADSLSD